MPQIIPIKELRDTNGVSEMCMNAQEPIFITKNGYGDMVIMSKPVYEKTIAQLDFYRKIVEAQKQVEQGQVVDGLEVMSRMKEKYGL